jgi:hypothetical protein
MKSFSEYMQSLYEIDETKIEIFKTIAVIILLVPTLIIAVLQIKQTPNTYQPRSNTTKVVVVGKSTAGVDRWGEVHVETFVKPLGTHNIRSIYTHPLYFMSKVGDTVEVETDDLRH